MFYFEQRALVREQERQEWLNEAARERLAQEAAATPQHRGRHGLLALIASMLRTPW